MNKCVFSPCRSYRYTLEHVWDEIQTPRLIQWIGLNPSTADENQLDPTLRRIRTFSQRLGFTGFVMTNLFAYRATDPKDMMAVADPFGPHNAHYLAHTADRCEMVVGCWGVHGSHLDADRRIDKILAEHEIYCLGTNAEGSPKHPLYVAGSTELRRWEGVRTQ